jgi:hypothetical protein
MGEINSPVVSECLKWYEYSWYLVNPTQAEFAYIKLKILFPPDTNKIKTELRPASINPLTPNDL